MDPKAKSSTGLEGNIAGALCYLLGFITGIVFLAIEKDSKFVKFHAFQSTITFVGLFAVQVFLGLTLIGAIFSLFIGLAAFVLWLVLMFKAFQGEAFKLPIVGDIAEKQALGS
jgi:uncharacterized membrane protein